MASLNHEFKSKLKLSRLFQLPDVCEGYQLQQAFYTAMTVDCLYWQILLTLQSGQAGTPLVSDYILMQELKHTWFMTQDDPKPFLGPKKTLQRNRNFKKNLRFYSGASSCFHAKMAFLRYTGGENLPDYYRIGVFSKNLEAGDADQNICILDGFAISDEPTENGLRLWSYLKHCRDNYDRKSYTTKRAEAEGNADTAQAPVAGAAQPVPDDDLKNHLDHFESIQKIRLPEECQVYFNGLGADGIEPSSGGTVSKPDTCLWDVLIGQTDLSVQEAEPKLYAVCRNPYVGLNYWAVSKPSDPAVPGKKPALQIRNRYQKNTVSEFCSDKTHMKLYWKKMSERGGKWEFWSGSANCSAAALGKVATGGPVVGDHVECLVRVTDLTDTQITQLRNILQAKSYKIMKDEPNSILREKENDPVETVILRAIVAAHQFRYVSSGKAVELQVTDGQGVKLKKETGKVWEYLHGNTAWGWTVTADKAFRHAETYDVNHANQKYHNTDEVIVSLWQKVEADNGAVSYKLMGVMTTQPQGFRSKSFAEQENEAQENALYELLNANWGTKVMRAPTRKAQHDALEARQLSLKEMQKLSEVSVLQKEQVRQKYEEFLDFEETLARKAIPQAALDAKMWAEDLYDTAEYLRLLLQAYRTAGKELPQTENRDLRRKNDEGLREACRNVRPAVESLVKALTELSLVLDLDTEEGDEHDESV